MNRIMRNVLFILLKVPAGFPISSSAKDSLPALLIRKLQWCHARPAGSGNNFRADRSARKLLHPTRRRPQKSGKGSNPRRGHMTLRWKISLGIKIFLVAGLCADVPMRYEMWKIARSRRVRCSFGLHKNKTKARSTGNKQWVSNICMLEDDGCCLIEDFRGRDRVLGRMWNSVESRYQG